jgi:hypothetical protein
MNIARLLPATQWLRGYERGWFRADLAAGVTLAACPRREGLEAKVGHINRFTSVADAVEALRNSSS